jgi:hypothetical protein
MSITYFKSLSLDSRYMFLKAIITLCCILNSVLLNIKQKAFSVRKIYLPSVMKSWNWTERQKISLKIMFSPGFAPLKLNAKQDWCYFLSFRSYLLIKSRPFYWLRQEIPQGKQKSLMTLRRSSHLELSS